MVDDQLNPINVPRGLPSVEALAVGAPGAAPDSVVRTAARRVIDEARVLVLSGGTTTHEALQANLAAELDRHRPPSRVLNGTGVLLHTNLGRAPLTLPPDEYEGLGYVPVEIDLVSGDRGRRFDALERDLAELTGAEAALVVNNNAAALLLTLSALAAGGQVIVSRGQLVEIGGSFRVPEIITQGGASLCEVGTTNKTHPRDIEQAIGPNTAMVLEVHPSNFAQIGFTASVSTSEAAAIAHRSGLVMVHDIGSGLVDASAPWLSGGPPPWLRNEPAARQVLAAGADLVTFSTDKVLGGPQGGVVAGRGDLVDRLRRHPLQRALRYDKVRAAHLHATVVAHLDGSAATAVPFWAMASSPVDALEQRAHAVAASINETVGRGVAAGHRVHVSVVAVDDSVGAGAAASASLPGAALAVHADLGCERLSVVLRRGHPAVLARVHRDRLLISMRTIAPTDDHLLATAISAALRTAPGPNLDGRESVPT